MYASLNPTQRRHLYDGLVHLERQLSALEAILAPPASLFPKYADDLDPARRQALHTGIAAARSVIAQLLADEAITPEPPRTGTAQAVRAHLSVLELAAEELGARSMRGYGELEPGQTEALDRLALAVRQSVTAIWPSAPEAVDTTPPTTPEALADALADATDTTLEAMAEAVCIAAQQRQPNDALPLAAGDVLIHTARQIAAAHLHVEPSTLPVADIDRIRWRLDTPRLAALGHDYLLKSFRRQLAPRRTDIEAALRAYAVRALTAGARGKTGARS